MAHVHRDAARVEILAGCLLVALGLPACGGGGGGGGGGNPAVLAESEPNGTPAQANALTLGRPGAGSVAAAGDVDFYSIRFTAGTYVKIELFATRLDQAAWDGAVNVPRLTLLAPDGTTVLLEHDPNGSVSDGWSWGPHDLDFPLYRVPATGTHYVGVEPGDDTLPGGAYAVRASVVSLPAAQLEFEPAGTTGANDTPNTSQNIQPGIVHGFHAEGDLDYYAITITTPRVLRFEVTGYRNGVHDGDDGYFDPALQLFDSNGTALLALDDDSFFFDPAIQFAFEDAGTYFLEVAEAGGVGDASYVLSYSSAPATAAPETEPNDTTATADPIAYGGSVSGSLDMALLDLYAFPGSAGDMVRIQLFDAWNLQDAADFVAIEVLAPDGATTLPTGGFFDFQTATAILQEDGTHYIRAMSTGGLTDYRLELSLFRSAQQEAEPNDTIAAADAALATRAAGSIGAPGDSDVFPFDAPEDRLTVLAIYAGRAATGSDGAFEYSGHGSDLAPLVTVTDGLGTVLATSTSDPASIFTESATDPLPTAALAFVPSSAGPFYVRLESALGAGGPTHTYVIEKR
ncbi:MAG: DVUA0089 family protein [Planctomycetota bacterium]